MDSSKKRDYSQFDRPEILNILFHPRPDLAFTSPKGVTEDFMIPVDTHVKIGARLHLSDKKSPSIIFFHGNGEIVSDYDDIAPIYTSAGINFFIADYRGYGDSTGTPTVSAMMSDCHHIFNYIEKWLKENGYTRELILMGRSLGSASAIELAGSYQERVSALIIESGFAYVMPLLKLLGGGIGISGIEEKDGPNNIEKIRTFTKKTLIIHAEHDHIIPFAEGVELYENVPSPEKTFLEIKDADHNNLFFKGISDYMKAIETLSAKVSGTSS